MIWNFVLFFWFILIQYMKEKEETLEDLRDPNFHNVAHFTMSVDTPINSDQRVQLKDAWIIQISTRIKFHTKI